MNKYVTVAGVAALMVASPSTAAELITNGTFEAGLTGFAVSPGTEIFALKGSDFIPCCGVTGSAAAMNNMFAVFGGGQLPNISILSQPFQTLAGATYTLSFDYGVLGAAFPQALTYALSGGLTGGGTVNAVGDNNLDSTFESFSFSFVATGGSTTLGFTLAPSPSENVDGILDNVSVQGPAVPEPATWAMMVLGFALVGAGVRRRRQAFVAA